MFWSPLCVSAACQCLMRKTESWSKGRMTSLPSVTSVPSWWRTRWKIRKLKSQGQERDGVTGWREHTQQLSAAHWRSICYVDFSILTLYDLPTWRCLQVHLHGEARGPTHDRHDVDHVPEARRALGAEESPQLGETGRVWVSYDCSEDLSLPSSSQ